MRSLRPALLLTLAACQPGADDSASETATGTMTMSESTGPDGQTATGSTGESATEPTTADDTTTGHPILPLDAPCALDPAAATRLAVITNNFVDPAALHVVDLAAATLTADIAAVPGDPALAWGDDKLLVLGRYGFNTIDVLDGETWTALASLAVKLDGVDDPNPQALAFGPDGRAYLTLLASAQVPVHDFALAPAATEVDRLDLGAFADADGSPEPGVAFTCGATLFVGIQRLVDFAPVDLSYLVAIDLATGAPIDLDPATDGPQALPLRGPWPKQVRLDPTDPDGHTVLVLTSGVERIDLAHGTSSWAVDPAVLAAAGIDGFDPQAFAVAADGASVYLLATDGDYPSSAVFHVGLDGRAAPSKLLPGLTAREKAIERVGDRLWVGDAAMGDPRLRVLDLAQDPPAELASIATPGDPYLFLALP